MGHNLSEADKKLLSAKTVEETKAALEAGANIEAREDSLGMSALILAAQNNNIEQMKLLIEAGANVNGTDARNSTALMWAQTAEQTKLLISAGADVNAKNQWGYTALMEAVNVADKDKKIPEILISAGADINAKNKDGKTVLDYANEEEKKLINAAVKKVEYDKKGLKVDNVLAGWRKKVANKTGLSEITLPDWAKVAEARLSKVIEGNNAPKQQKKTIAKTTVRNNSAER